MNKQKKFLELFEPVKENLWRFCLSMSRNRDAASDLLQESILIAYQNFETLRTEKAFLSYLLTIASRTLYAIKNKNSKIENDEEFDFDSLVGSNTPADVLTDVRNLYEALDKLPENQKEAIILSDIMGFSRQEICDIQNVSLDALKARLHRGKLKLALLLGADDDININENTFSLKGDLK